MTLPDPEIQEVIDQARQLDLYALGQLFDIAYPAVYRYVSFRLGEGAETDQVVDNVFNDLLIGFSAAGSAAAKGRRKGRPAADLFPWLFKTAGDLVDSRISAQKGHKTAAASNRTADPGGHDEKAWLGRLARKCLSQLPIDQQRLIALRFSQASSLEEVARISGNNFVDLRLSQMEALTSLRKLLEEEV